MRSEAPTPTLDRGAIVSPMIRPEDVPVIVLCGGMGTRLREETERSPKPLVDIGGRPILWHIMKLYSAHGFRRFVLCIGYRGWQIKDYFLRYREQAEDLTVNLASGLGPRFHGESLRDDWEVTIAETGLTTGTGARLRRVRHHLDNDVFMLTYGDGVADVDLVAALAFHERHGRLATVTGVHPVSRYGELSIADDQVVEFDEKPSSEGYVSGGFYTFDRSFVEQLPDDPDLVLEREPLRKLSARGQLMVFRHDGFWAGMDTYRDYLELNRLWDAGNPPWKVWTD
jgi:glucose-1-phosphate cytidylyltransferase